MWKFAGAIAAIFSSSTPLFAAETVTYTYDANGRLIRAVRSGSVNNGVTTEYSRDKADNRNRVKVVGSSNPAP
jgi:uncharacterized protein RhaS with RHS repeats